MSPPPQNLLEYRRGSASGFCTTDLMGTSPIRPESNISIAQLTKTTTDDPINGVKFADLDVDSWMVQEEVKRVRRRLNSISMLKIGNNSGTSDQEIFSLDLSKDNMMDASTSTIQQGNFNITSSAILDEKKSTAPALIAAAAETLKKADEDEIENPSKFSEFLDKTGLGNTWLFRGSDEEDQVDESAKSNASSRKVSAEETNDYHGPITQHARKLVENRNFNAWAPQSF